MKRKNITIGILAHVDAGKTTLCESMLYLTGVTRKQGRVDRKDSFLDTGDLERSRGITIFSKQAVLPLENTDVYLIDTPGHTDFSAETERTLQILDYAVLVISGTDGVQAHTQTVWNLLRQHSVPCFVFVTKMDLPVSDRDAVLRNVQFHLSDACLDFADKDGSLRESLAMCSEEAMEEYLECGEVNESTVAELIKERKVFPCFFGSGLKNDGVFALLKALDSLTAEKKYPQEFSAKVYKIMRDSAGERMTCLKITGGSLKVRTQLLYKDGSGNEVKAKVNSIRLYSGIKYTSVEEASAGQVCAVLGLDGTFIGQSLGSAGGVSEPMLTPVLSYTVILPEGTQPAAVYPGFLQLAEEDPMLQLNYSARTRAVNVSLMGKVQAEVFRSIVKERFDLDIRLDKGHILYRETIRNKVEGVGHFEPLRHYAEVHLILEPLPAGSGIHFATACPEDELDRNWQRLILTHLAEKTHPGVLTGSPVTDMKITLAAGKAHIKHTEGGDFRQATYRAVRQGLMKAESVLLEPYYAFTADVSADTMGRVISDVREMGGEFNLPETVGELVRVTGVAPVSRMNGYYDDFASFTHGRGRLTMSFDSYRPCRDAEKVIEEIGYDPCADTENTPDSVFCSHGAGVTIAWNRVQDFMHLESCLKPEKKAARGVERRAMSIDDKELEAIMEREFGPIKRPMYSAPVRNEAPAPAGQNAGRKSLVLVDGYNVIFAEDGLKALASDSMDLARQRLADMLANWAAFQKCELMLVFDAYRTPSNPGSKTIYNGISIAYTDEGESADAYIERLSDEIGKNYAVRVVTNDSLIRLSAGRSGVLCVSAGEFMDEVEENLRNMRTIIERRNGAVEKTRLGDIKLKGGEGNG